VLTELGLDRSFFHESEKNVLLFIENFYSRFGTIPELEIVEAELGIKFPRQMPQAPLAFWAERIKERRLHEILERGIEDTRRLLASGKPKEAYNRLQSIAVASRTVHQSNPVIKVSDASEMVVQRHREYQRASTLLGLSLGFPTLDNMTGGLQNEDFLVVAGRPGAGKTYLLLHMALNTYFAQNRKVLFVSMEMPASQCTSRLLSLISHVPHGRLRSGKLSPYAMRKVEEARAMLAERDEFFIMEGSLSTKISDLLMRVREIEPDIVFVDGAYMVEPDRREPSTWERVSSVARDLRKLALDLRIPVVASYQQGRKSVISNRAKRDRSSSMAGGTLETIGYSDTIGQAAAIALDISLDETSESTVDDFSMDSGETTRILTVMKDREGGFAVIKILFDLFRMRIAEAGVIFAQSEVLESENDFS